MSNKDGKVCATCIYYEHRHTDGNYVEGMCHLMPPSGGYHSGWAKIYSPEWDWCSKHEMKLLVDEVKEV